MAATMATEPMYTFDETYYELSSLDYGNETFDYKNIPYFGEIKKVPLYEVILKSYLYAMIIFFSLIGNTLIILVVLRHRQMRTTTNFYIVNLAVADILVTVFCTWVHLVNNLNNNNWVLGGFFCKFNTFSQVLCLIASVLSLTLIAYDRFFGIVFALKAHMSRRKARFSIAGIWVCSFAIAAPLLWFRELKERQWQDHTERWCDDSWPVKTKLIPGTNYTVEYMPARTIYFTFVSAVMYFFPMCVMALAYSIIIRKLKANRIPGERVDAGHAAQQKNKRKVIAMLVTIMAVFGVCWLPYQIVLLYSELRETRDRLEEWYFTMQFLAGCFAYSNSAVNPLIYAGFNKNFKEAILSLRSGMEVYDYSRRRSSAHSAAYLRRASKDAAAHKLTNKISTQSKSTTCSSNTASPIITLEGRSTDASVPLISRLSSTPTPPLLPSDQMITQIKKYRLEAEKYSQQGNKLSPISSLMRSYTERRDKYDDSDDTESDTPKLRRHSYDSRCPKRPLPDCSDRIFGE